MGAVLKRARGTTYTQQQIATRLGISLWSYCRLENGHRKWDPSWLPRLPHDMRKVVAEHLLAEQERPLPALREMAETGFSRG
jgi:hypothetical protein